jgi:hypothetical protein
MARRRDEALSEGDGTSIARRQRLPAALRDRPYAIGISGSRSWRPQIGADGRIRAHAATAGACEDYRGRILLNADPLMVELNHARRQGRLDGRVQVGPMHEQIGHAEAMFASPVPLRQL